MYCQFSFFFYNPNILFILGTYYNIFFSYVLNIFFGGPKAKKVKSYHAVAAAVCATAKRPGGLTVGHPYGTQSLELSLEGGMLLIKKMNVKNLC